MNADEATALAAQVPNLLRIIADESLVLTTSGIEIREDNLGEPQLIAHTCSTKNDHDDFVIYMSANGSGVIETGSGYITAEFDTNDLTYC